MAILVGEEPRLQAKRVSARGLKWLAPYAALFSIVVATILISCTYPVLTQTDDEAAHIACGMEWLQHGTYLYEALHPPLARVAAAILPSLNGSRDTHLPEMWADGNALLNEHGTYQKNLTLSRLGILPFFWFACFLVWRFMAERFGRWHAAASVLLLACCPVVLAHSGLATTDAPLMAMFLFSLLAWFSVLERPRWSTAALAGLAFGLAIITKFTEIPFFSVSGGIVFVAFWIERRRFPIPLRMVAAAVALMALTIWAGYRFSVGPIVLLNGFTGKGAQHFAALKPWEQKILLWPGVPAPAFFRGILEAFLAGKVGRISYSLGHVYRGGRWYFFPLAILTKTQLPMLILFAIGVAWVLWWRAISRNKAYLLLLAGIIGPLAVAIKSNLNIGLRHVLPVYPFLAMIAAVAVIQLWKIRAGQGMALLVRSVVVLLLAWDVVSCVRATPDFLAYFNEAAAPRADYYLVESDVDWGQDLGRLNRRLHQLRVREFWYAYNGKTDIASRLNENWHELKAGQRAAGWIAIREQVYEKYHSKFGWLDGYPHQEVGKSIRLYYVPGAPAT